MAEPATWLQCTISRAEWDTINARRLKLGLSWKEIILPATLAHLDRLEANPPAPEQPVPSTETSKTKKRAKVNPQS